MAVSSSARKQDATHPAGHQASFGLEGRTLYLPHMPYGGTYLLAPPSARSASTPGRPATPTNAHSSSGGDVTSGDECYPQKITIGDFLRMIEDEGPDKVAFLMPTANGPCRFGQYMHLIRPRSTSSATPTCR